MKKGYLALLLHAHLPFVRHPEHNYFLEENWLFEAITETYLPLIEVFKGCEAENIPFKLTMSLTPPLVSMLTDVLLQKRYVRHIESLLELTEKEIIRTRWQPELNDSARMYKRKFETARKLFCEDYDKNIIGAFRYFQEKKNLELVTCCATHGFLPLMPCREAVEAQIKVAVDLHTRHIGQNPRGIWLAECAYNPGDDKVLKKYGIDYFFVDTHGILYGTPRPHYGVFAPVRCPSGVAAFGRDVETSRSVWSAEVGYPGNFHYREFYRDIGFDLDFEYIKPYIHPDGIRINTGIKYFRITGKTEQKQPYNEKKALETAAHHAGDFIYNRIKQSEYLYDLMQQKCPLIVSPYDAELFGHWWYEGPEFLNFLFRKLHYDQDTVALTTPSEYLAEHENIQISTPTLSSWGHKGYNEYWLNDTNDWIYFHLHEAAERMVELAHQHRDAYGLLEQALNQAARELLLAQSSDWAFIMKTNTMVEYAVKRTETHIERFNKLYEDITENTVDPAWLYSIAEKDNIFPDIDFRIYCGDVL